jgi:hypothetical protein
LRFNNLSKKLIKANAWRDIKNWHRTFHLSK